MSRRVKRPQESASADLVVVYTRIPKRDLDELQRREGTIGATVAAQIRIFVHEGLKARGGFVK